MAEHKAQDAKTAGSARSAKPAVSLASRLNRNFLGRLLGAYLFTDLLILLVVIFTGAYQAEKAALGSAWDLHTGRQLAYAEDMPAKPLPWSQKLAYLEYRLTPRDQERNQAHDQKLDPGEEAAAKPSTIVIQAGPFAQTVYRSGRILLVLQFLHFVRQYFKGKAANYRILEGPLQDMADQAELLSQFDLQQEAYHDMENAIESLSPATPNAKIEMGDPNLEGLEDAINDLLARTHAAYRQQIRFVSDASHELRTPIAVIQGYADLLARWGRKDEAVLEEAISAIQAETGQMKTLVEDLLFLARGDAGRNPMNMEQVDLAQLVREAGEEYQMLDSQHTWQVQADQPILAQGDRKMLKQVLRILVDNAIRYSPPDTPIQLKAIHMEGQEPAFQVQDMGAGIPSADLPKIFDRFYRSDPARKREGGGTGLGLAIAKWIVDNHQGHITVLSREDLGTRFTVVLPAYSDSDEGPAQA
ncbi:MAG: ATP-binding protein [Eubacteriales bacterium]|nr:ATP-binding protein [Clostridiales bacterium]MDY5836657.1 ATP-binding protein [Eubacteriales bacterium]